MSKVFNFIEENEEVFNKSFDRITKDIRNEFLAITEDNREGYFIPLSKACDWLRIDYQDTPTFRDNFKRRMLDTKNHIFVEAKSEQDMSGHYIYRKNTEGDVRIKLPWFNGDGFKILCMVSKAPKAMFVRRYYLDLEKDYIAKLKMTVEEFKQTTKLREQELRDIKDAQKESIILREENTMLNRAIDQRDQQIIGYYNQKVVLEDRVERIREFEKLLTIDYDKIDIDDRIGLFRLSLYEKTYGKPLNIYLVSDKWIADKFASAIKSATKSRRPKKSATRVEGWVSDDCDDTNNMTPPKDSSTEKPNTAGIDVYAKYNLLNYALEMDGMEFDAISSVWIKDYIKYDDAEDRHLYFYIPKLGRVASADQKALKLWDTLYFYSDAHYMQFAESLNEFRLNNCYPQVQLKNKLINDIFMMPYHMIKNAHNDSAASLSIIAMSQTSKGKSELAVKKAKATPTKYVDSDLE